MVGFNGMEGIPFTGRMLSGYLAKQNKSLEDGCSAGDMQSFLELTCSMMVSGESPELCANFITKEYGIDEAKDDVERLFRYTEFAGRATPSVSLPKEISYEFSCERFDYLHLRFETNV